MTAFVRGVILVLASAIDKCGQSSDVISANTGTAPTYKTALTVATNVSAGTSTSSPGPIPKAARQRCNPAVQELTAVQDREDKQSTGLQDGIAVPHGKTAAVSSLKLAIGLAPNGIDFNSLDGAPAKLLFLLVAPPDQAGPHVQALAEIAKLAQSKAFCKALVNAESAQEAVELLKGE